MIIATAQRLVFDEIYYVPASLDIFKGIASNLEHPPLVKILMSFSIGAFGNNLIGWRIVSVVSALIATWLTYKVAQHYVSERLATYSAALLSTSTIFLLVGSTGILDMPTLAFSLAGLYTYLQRKHLQSATLFGLALLSKEIALLPTLATGLYALTKKVNKRKLATATIILLTVSLGGLWIYDLAYQPTIIIHDKQGNPVGEPIQINNPFNHIYAVITYQRTLNNLRAPNPNQYYPPLSWTTPFAHNSWNPLSWYWAKTQTGKQIANWQAQPNPLIEYTMFPLLAALPYFAWKRKDSKLWLLWLWTATTYLPWLIAGFLVRMEANFYIVYSLPTLAIGTSYIFSLITNQKLKWMLATGYFVAASLAFLAYFPIRLL
jgi:4-amino-4-deoxy-L-arabinose transferase-like glycosyltransferase